MRPLPPSSAYLANFTASAPDSNAIHPPGGHSDLAPLYASTQSAFSPDHLPKDTAPHTTEDVQQHRSNLACGSSRQSTPQPAELTGSSRRELSPFSKDYLHSLPSKDYALPTPKTVVLEKLNRQRAQNSPDSANYTLADITPVVTDLLLTRHLTSDDFFRTRSEAQLRSALIQRRSSQDIAGPSLPSGSTTESRETDHPESYWAPPTLDEGAHPFGHIMSGADAASVPSTSGVSRIRRGKERAAPPYPSSTQSSGPTRGARPLLAEHQAVMAQLPKTLNRSYRSKISQFLCHLEQQGLRWHLLQEKNAQQRWRLRSIRPLRAMDLTQARARQLTGASS